MTILTRDFGAIEIDSSEILSFVRPIYGFEQLSKFVLLSDESVGQQFVWLQSIEDENICFILADPTITLSSYSPNISEDAVRLLGGGELVPWVIAIIASEFRDSTVNLKSPILINPKTKLAMQVVLEQDYPIRQCILGSKEMGV